MKRSPATRVLAAVLAVSVQALFLPAAAGDGTASLSGTVVSSETETPVAGARLHAGDPKTGHVFTAQPTGEDGGFSMADLPAASYELAVETNRGLYVVEASVKLSPGDVRTVTVAINPQVAPDPASEQEKKKKRGAGFWNNPVTASLVVIGSATILGYLIKKGTDDETDTSPSTL